MKIEQVPHQQKWQVLLGGQVVGHIKIVDGLYQYFPKGMTVGGDKFATLDSVVSSLGGED